MGKGPLSQIQMYVEVCLSMITGPQAPGPEDIIKYHEGPDDRFLEVY